jgi:dTDP-glucose 4,6-dehydratase
MSIHPSLPLPSEDLNDLVIRMGDAWDELRGARLLLTGCTGFFGAWLLETLLAAVDQRGLDTYAVLLTRDPEAFAKRMPHIAKHPAVGLYRGDIRDFESPAGAFTHLVHGATTPSAALTTGQPRLMLDTILGGTKRALEVSKGLGVRDVLYISSGAIYGPQTPGLSQLSEHYNGAPDPSDPAASYGLGKRLAEHLCGITAQESGIRIRVARCFSFLGPQQSLDSHLAAPSFIGDALSGRPILVQSDGCAVRSWLYGRDLAWWLWTILLKGRPGWAYNVGSDDARTIWDLAAVVSQSTGVDVHIVGAAGMQPPHRYIPDISRATTDLGLGISVPLEIAVQRTLAWHRSTA